MRLWHYRLIPLLPRQQLLGQHRECCALRGNGWGKKHSTVNYIFKYDPAYLVNYHCKVISELERRGYSVDPAWKDNKYRGKNCEKYEYIVEVWDCEEYPEHDDRYLEECLANLKTKGIAIDKSHIL
ncbi:MAG: hypothetical protein H6Q73_1072 [Firmicutes bacterium]|nr:hypothetical protein [Bacillota bacterium]